MWKLVILFSLSVSFPAMASNFSLSKVVSDINALEAKIKKEKSQSKKIAYIKAYKKHLAKQKTPSIGVHSQYKDLILSSFERMDLKLLAKNRCADVERELYTQFSPQQRNIASAPTYLIPALRILAVTCK
jgi:tetrahydrodipicolinate N-succinyltransferase